MQAASTALASTLGTGNIVGTAQAIAMGGPGAVFWMWAAALLGMAVKFAEIGLSVATRRRDGAGYSGGPMYYIGSLGEKFRPLALMYALLAALSAFGIGNLSQISSAAGAVAGAAEKIAPELDPRRLRLWLGVILTLTAWLILRGGAAGVGRAAERLVPSMAGLFLLLGLVLPLLLKPAIALDKFLLGFFYHNSEKLQATDLARGIMLLLGLVVSVIGAIWWCILLFG